MNANEIWSGQNYAFVMYPSKGVNYYSNAVPVQVMRVFKEKGYGAERARTMVEVIMLKEDDDGKLEHRVQTNGQEITRTIRARQIYARWDEHAVERKRRADANAEFERKRAEEREAARLRYEAEAEARRQAEAERRQREEYERNRLLNYLDMKIPREIVDAVQSEQVILNRSKLEKFLGIKRLEVVNG